jgi:hypothetical protein
MSACIKIMKRGKIFNSCETVMINDCIKFTESRINWSEKVTLLSSHFHYHTEQNIPFLFIHKQLWECEKKVFVHNCFWLFILEGRWNWLINYVVRFFVCLEQHLRNERFLQSLSLSFTNDGHYKMRFFKSSALLLHNFVILYYMWIICIVTQVARWPND